MKNVMIVGTQFGDEGKGKAIDLLGSGLVDGYAPGVTVRAQGGNNAGHTTVVDGVKTITHLVPSAMQNPEMIGIMGNGMVLDLNVLVDEITKLEKMGCSLQDRLYISERANVIMPWHPYLDGEKDKTQGIGTTRKGIGPSYTDKIARHGIRLCNFKDGTLQEKIEKNIERLELEDHFHPEGVYEQQVDLFACIRNNVRNIQEVMDSIMNNENPPSFLFEAAQGTMLDIDFGTYPTVTSSNSVAGGCLTGTGVGPDFIHEVWGIVKAYITRVGNGPFPTEIGGSESEKYCAKGLECDIKYELETYGIPFEEVMKGDEEEVKYDHQHKNIIKLVNSKDPMEKNVGLRLVGEEYGATTKRPRRIGWMDGVILRHAVAVNGLNYIVLTKLDVLSGLPELNICTRYEREHPKTDNGNEAEIAEVHNYPPASQAWMRDCKPHYERMDGWPDDIIGIRKFEKLPIECQNYVKRIEEIAGVPVKMIGVGPDREQTIVR
ncbi:adenylosuccinate synthetase [candidate division KSB1 bacterium]